MSDDLIRRSDAIDALCKGCGWREEQCEKDSGFWCESGGLIRQEIPTIEPKRGEWEEKEAFHNGDDEPIIEEWQSALCSVCHKYHTTPYMYYFNDYNFCPNCGARMKGADDGRNAD